MNILIDGINLSLDLLEGQKFRNMEVIPIRINNPGNQDLLTLKRGIEIGVVEISECEISTVGTVLARNNANIPLVLIDGDEITGAKQNRIMNRSLIVPPKTTLPISVSCSEQGRWHYGRSRNRPIIRDFDLRRNNYEYNESPDYEFEDERSNFDYSDFAADFSTRRDKSRDLFEKRSCQSTVWNSISRLENKTSFRSQTSALNDNFENHRSRQDEYLKHFKLEFGQSGAIFIIDGQIKGLELFANPTIYQDYHEKIFRSYIMEAISNKASYSCADVSFYQLEAFLREISISEFRHSENKGIGRHLNFSNKFGTGSVLIDGRNLVHMNYFNTFNPEVSRKNSRRYGSFRDFADNY